jgi:DeoR/GlpR family transcriptional regulator of sugar metabolism
MLAEERRKSILNLIQENGSARTAELARKFNVSGQTIRRDLYELEVKGLVSKNHGGGVLVRWQGADYRERAILRQQEKQLIAYEAVAQVRYGMTVALGPGTTTEAIAHLLNGMELRVITNSLAVAQAITSRDTTVYLTGGHYRPGSELVTGEWTEQNLKNLFADVSFVGISGIGAEAGYTVTQFDEALVLRQFIRVAKKAVVVMDSSKFHRVAQASVAPLGAAHALITDADAPQEQLDILRQRGVEVIVARARSGTFAKGSDEQ